MQIKDVEKLTGLTAKSIRFYETKGLIEMERNEENDYRNYSEDNVTQLKLIKMFRYLDFSIEEIRELLNKYERKGSFYYQIKVDGKTITFHVPSPNDDIQRYMEDSYLELEEFDKALVDIGVSKVASDKNHDKCDLDKQYVDRFLRIVGNK